MQKNEIDHYLNLDLTNAKLAEPNFIKNLKKAKEQEKQQISFLLDADVLALISTHKHNHDRAKINNALRMMLA